MFRCKNRVQSPVLTFKVKVQLNCDYFQRCTVRLCLPSAGYLASTKPSSVQRTGRPTWNL